MSHRRSAGKSELPTKPCASCGRPFSSRKRWEGTFDDVKYCSAACRRQKVSKTDRALEELLREMVRDRPGGSLCPSEVARRAAPSGDEGWQVLMEPVRRAARRLALLGEVEVLQGGRVVDPGTARGPVRVRAKTTSPSRAPSH